MGVIHTDRFGEGTPGLHALIIGAGTYKFGDVVDCESMTAPIQSAREIATWLLSRHNNTQAHLHSLEVLISGGTFQYKGVRSREPTLENLRSAIKEWKARGASHADNQLLFYFCGHGVSASEQALLLASDFGRDPDNPYRHTINFRGMVRGLRDCAARKQIFMVDTCRTEMDDTLYDNIGSGDPIFLPEEADAKCDQATLFAARLNQPAKGTPDGMSHFMRAFLSAIDGPACEGRDGRWLVGPASLLLGINAVNGEDHPGVAQKATGNEISENFCFHEPVTPQARVHVSCDPRQEPAPTLFHQITPNFDRAQGPRVAVSAPSADGKWRLRLNAGDYTFSVTKQGPAPSERNVKKSIAPPYTDVQIDCK